MNERRQKQRRVGYTPRNDHIGPKLQRLHQSPGPDVGIG